MDSIAINNLNFKPYIAASTIANRVGEMAFEIKQKHENLKDVVFLVLLNGAYVFASDLFRHWDESLEIEFIKISSYQDLQSTGKVVFERNNLERLKDKHVIIIEDIIDSGRTLTEFTKFINTLGLASLQIATLLLKPDKLEFEIEADYIGFIIPDLFVIGYGLDYNQFGRNLRDLYILDE